MDASPTRIVAIVDDLMMQSRVESASRASGLPIAFPRSRDEFWQEVRSEAPTLVVVGISSTRQPWETLVAELRRDPEFAGTPVLAFGSHMDLALRQRAIDAGCDRVVANSQIATDFAATVRQVVEAESR